jgi:hypothetical protein
MNPHRRVEYLTCGLPIDPMDAVMLVNRIFLPLTVDLVAQEPVSE